MLGELNLVLFVLQEREMEIPDEWTRLWLNFISFIQKKEGIFKNASLN